MENQLLQGNPAASGSPCWRSSTIVNKYRFGIMDLQMENQLVQGNQEASILYHGSPNGEPTVTREPSSVRLSMLEIHYFSEWDLTYFILVSWISKWRTNCFRETKKHQFRIMDLQMENQLLQGNQAALSSPCWRSNTEYLIFHFIILDLQMENHLFQVNQKL